MSLSHSSLPDPSDSEGQAVGRPVARFRYTALASSLVDATTLDSVEAQVRIVCVGEASESAALDAVGFDKAVADLLVQQGTLTRFQADQMLAGRRRLMLGQYRILDQIGQGGMGQVFKAEHVMMGREVAVKVLPRAQSTPETEAAFQREIRMLARLDHANLVRALDAGHDGKVYYLVTEIVAGVDLRKQVLKYGPLDQVSAASVISQAARGLGYAHSQGLVHRDVKPGNLLVTGDGLVKVLDLGLAGSVLEAESTRLGRVVGTMDYMAPEQIRMPDSVGPAADMYGLGCSLYFSLVGQVPFPGGTRQEKAKRQLTETPTPIGHFAPQISQDFCRLVEAMMHKNPAERIGSAAEVIERLRPWTPEVPVTMSRIPRNRTAVELPRQQFPVSTPVKPPPLPTTDRSRGHVSWDGARSARPSKRASVSDASIDSQSQSPWESVAADHLRASIGRFAHWGLGTNFWIRVGKRVFWIGVTAALVGLAFGVAIELIGRINPRIAAMILGEKAGQRFGQLAFWLMLAVQFLAMRSTGRRRN